METLNATAPSTIDVQAPVSQDLERISVRDWMLSNGFTQVSKAVNVNTNGYPFVTFISATNVAENVYFSKGAAEMVGEGESIARGFFEPFMIAEVTNANGETRTKLVRKTEGRLDLEDLF